MKYLSLPIVVLFTLLLVAAANAQDYVGSEECDLCHGSKYDEWVDSGHHYKLNAIVGAQAPTYPFEYHEGTPNVVDLPVVYGNQLGWDDVSYVIGGYRWKARFIDPDGYIYTGDVDDVTQWNIWTQEWVGYHAGEVNKPFDCGRCHTTGYDDQGNQGGHPGLIGTWNEDGIGCEACHGPGSDHIDDPTTSNITLDESAELCGQCHYRDSEHRIAVSGLWIKHHEQYDEFLHSPHYENLTCGTCHDPHPSTVYDQGGLKASPTCTTCHSGYEIEGKESLECRDCHMPYSAKSGQYLSENQADVSSHQFRIWVTTSPKDSMFYDDPGGGTFVRLDENDQVYGNTLDFVCLRCHTDWTIDDVYDVADGIHVEGIGVKPTIAAQVVDRYSLMQNFPNPFNPSTTIVFTVPRQDDVTLSVYDVSGRMVEELYSGNLKQGAYEVNFAGDNLASGVYIYRLTTSEGAFSKKMLLFK